MAPTLIRVPYTFQPRVPHFVVFEGYRLRWDVENYIRKELAISPGNKHAGWFFEYSFRTLRQPLDSSIHINLEDRRYRMGSRGEPLGEWISWR